MAKKRLCFLNSFILYILCEHMLSGTELGDFEVHWCDFLALHQADVNSEIIFLSVYLALQRSPTRHRAL